MNNLLLRAIALVFVFYSVSWGDDSTLVDTSAGYDTTLYIPKGVEGTVYGAIDSIDYETKLTQNPTVALFKSMLVPGLGQIGNRKYVKAALIIGLDAWLISSAVNHGRDASNLHNQFSAATDISERNKLYDNYLDSKDQRNKYTWFAVIVTFISMFDAYSDAHLSGFPEKNNPQGQKIGVSVEPSINAGIFASVNFSF